MASQPVVAKHTLKIVRLAQLQALDLYAQFLCRSHRGRQIELGRHVIWIIKPGNFAGLMAEQLSNQLGPFAPQHLWAYGSSGGIPNRPSDAVDDPITH